MRDLDLTGLKCPLPVLKTQKALEEIATGEQISVTTTDPMASLDIPHFCNQKGHELVACEETSIELGSNANQDSLSGHRFVIKKGNA